MPQVVSTNMKILRRSLLSLLVLSGVATAAHLASGPEVAQRIILAEISVDGVVVLRGSASDDGHPDADEVWGYLETLKFKPTDAFQSLNVAKDAKQLELLGTEIPVCGERKPGEKIRRERSIRLDMSYGGHADVRELDLVRGEPDRGGATWSVTAEDIESNASWRWITRRQADQLKSRR